MITIALIRAATIAETGVSVVEMDSPRRNAGSVRARWVAQWLCRQLTAASYPQIARAFGRDHSSIHHAVQRVQASDELRALALRVSARIPEGAP